MFKQPREFAMIQALLGLGRRDRLCAAPERPESLWFFGVEEKKVGSTATACKLNARFDGPKHSRRLEVFHGADLRWQIREWASVHRVCLEP